MTRETSIWQGIEQHHIALAAPLLIARGAKGMLACGYINPATCEKTGEACAIVTGVKSFDDMLEAEVIAVSEAAQILGVEVGQSGREALETFR
jgi:uncharacterized protein YunC (DUF1805 family)